MLTEIHRALLVDTRVGGHALGEEKREAMAIRTRHLLRLALEPLFLVGVVKIAAELREVQGLLDQLPP